MKASSLPLNRRQFIEKSARATGLVAAGGAALSGVARALAANPAPEANPFAYDPGEGAQTDPKLLQYELVQRFPTLAAEPRRLAIGPGQRLYVAAKEGVGILSFDGKPLGKLALTAPARCVAVAEDGAVFAGMRDHIEVFSPKGQRVTGWDTVGPRSWLTGLAVGPNDLFAADAAGRVVLRYDRSGKLLGRIGEKNKERNVPGLIVPSPYLAVALAPDGLLRVNNPGRHRIEAYTLSGDLEFAWGAPATSLQGFCGCCNPVGLTLLRDGTCVTAEKGLPRAKTYSADGTFQGVVAGPESFPENGQAGAINNKSDGLLGGLDVAADQQGMVFILDLVAEKISVWRKKA